MKLKEALELYDIIVTEPVEMPPEGGAVIKKQYDCGNRSMWMDVGNWWCVVTKDEETAVSWLIEGATPLSPMERAMRKWPIRKDGKKYYLGDRFVFPRAQNDGLWWADCNGPDDISEKEAVAYLLEGYKPELPTMVFKNEAGHVIEFKPKIAQELIDDLWRAGYRPTKESK